MAARGKHHRHHHKSKVLKANLKGANEVPGPGDTDGRGKALVRVNAKAGKVCFRLRWRNIAEPPTKAHIHKGAKGVAGPIVVTAVRRHRRPQGLRQGLDRTALRKISSATRASTT